MSGRVVPLCSNEGDKIIEQKMKSDEVAMVRVNEDLGSTALVTNETQNEVGNWISSHIDMRECMKFIQKDENANNPVCFCGYLKRDHNKRTTQNLPTENERWKSLSHTTVKATNAYGEIEFMGHGQKLAKYVRIDHTTDEQKVLTLLLDYWNLEHPNLLISVTGGAKNFHMRPKLKEVFRRGLMKAAASTGAWLVTGGMHAGVMKHVGEAVQEYQTAQGQKAKVVAIGIAPWGCVNNKESLIDPQGCWPATYRLEKPKLGNQSYIDKNHSHFILVDNGTQHQYATEIPFRARLERAISLMKTGLEDDAVSVPAVCLVLEGGPGTLETVKSAIQNGTPAVVVAGSGRAADILAYAYANSREKEVEVTDKLGQKHKKSVTIVDDEILKERIKAAFDNKAFDNKALDNKALDNKALDNKALDNKALDNKALDNKALDQRLTWVKECLEHRDHVTVFQLDGSDTVQDIDVAILQALLKVNKEQSLVQLKLALAWNRIDVAKSDIFFEDKRWEPGELHDVMYLALMQNQVDFVILFMESGLGLRDFLTINRMTQMYENVPKNTLLYELLKKERKGSVVNKRTRQKSTLEHMGKVIHMLMGDFYIPMYLRDERYQPGYVSNFKGGEFLKDEHRKPDFDEPSRELFIWCVLLNRIDMAMIFWDEGKEGVAAALVAQKLIKSMLSRTEDSELEQSMRTSQEHFEKLSVGCLSECYASDEKKARLLLVRQMYNFGMTTVLQLAVKADNKIFIAHSACQALLNNIWRGRIALDVNNFSVWLSVLCPPLLFVVIRYSEDDRHQLADEASHATKASQRKIERTDTNLSLDVVDRSQQNLISNNARNARRNSKLDGKNRKKLTVWQRIKYFYNAPMITFIHNCLSYMTFIIFYSILLLTRFYEKMDVWDYLLIFWVVTLFAEEIRQVATNESSSVILKLANYLSDVWNILDVMTIFTFIVGVILRLIPGSVCSDCFDAARIVFAINLMTFCFRILHIFSVHKELGPKLVMIGRMMVDLFFFIIILIVFIAAFGLASQAILYPNSTLSFGLLRDVFKKPYWQMYGELFLEELEGDVTCTSDPLIWGNGTQPRCPQAHWIVPALLGVYILITNVLMLNLLIAMFSYTFDNVQGQTDLYWYFQRYFLIKEYHDKAPLCPPFTFLSHVFIIFRSCVRKCCHKLLHNDHSFKMQLTDAEERQLVTWENMCAGDYLRNTKLAEESSMENQVKVTSERMDQLSQTVEKITETSFMGKATVSSSGSSASKLPTVLEERLTYLEDQMKRTSIALDWIISSMVEKGQGSKTGPPALVDIDKRREEQQKKKQEIANKEKEEYERLLLQQLELHTKSRTSQYPCDYQVILRFNVPNPMVPWEVAWAEYEPVIHTDQKVLEKPVWADIDLLAYEPANRPLLKFNDFDESCHVNRKSYIGDYEVKQGLPMNPMGRTGIVGRGQLGRWGPNHAGDPIVTRWAKNEKGEFLKDNDKKILEMVAIYRNDAKQWAIPGAILAADPVSKSSKPVHSCLKAEFSEEALGSLMDDPNKKDSIQKKLDKLFSLGEEVYNGYSDDPRNTDNSWIETVAINYHDEDGSILQHFQLRRKAGENAELVCWMKVSSQPSMYGAHLAILQKLANKHNASF